jgi:hypothetical protein
MFVLLFLKFIHMFISRGGRLRRGVGLPWLTNAGPGCWSSGDSGGQKFRIDPEVCL